MKEDLETGHCWACMTELIQTNQKVCNNCHRWQAAPWKYLNLSNAALAVVAALVSTGLALASKYESYQRSKDFNLYVAGQSLKASKRDLNFFLQNYSRLAILIDPTVLCVKNGDISHQLEFNAIERFRSFPPLMPEQKTSFVVASDNVQLTEGDELGCKVTFQNENRHKETYDINVRVTQ